MGDGAIIQAQTGRVRAAGAVDVVPSHWRRQAWIAARVRPSQWNKYTGRRYASDLAPLGQAAPSAAIVVQIVVNVGLAWPRECNIIDAFAVRVGVPPADEAGASRYTQAE